jgi:hypothetical protein
LCLTLHSQPHRIHFENIGETSVINTSIGGNRRFVFPIALVFLITLTTGIPLVSAQDTQNTSGSEMQATNKSKAKSPRKKSTKKHGTKETSSQDKSATGDTTGATGAATAGGTKDSAVAPESTPPNTAADATNVKAESTTPAKQKGRHKRGSGSSPSAGAKPTAAGLEPARAGATEDLSGTYNGVVNYADGGLSGPATLAITGNQFTLTPEGGTPVTGTISAVKTGGYTGVAMQMGTVSAAPTGAAATGAPAAAPATVSVRLKKSSKGIALTPVEGSTQKFSFTPAKSGKKKG